MTEAQIDALLNFLKGLSIANDDHDAYDALLAAFGRTGPHPTTRQAYYDTGSVDPVAAAANAPEPAPESVTEPGTDEPDAPDGTEPADDAEVA